MKKNKISLKLLTELSIYAYIIISLVSSVGSTDVKIIRVITVVMILLNIVVDKKIFKSSYCVWAIVFLLYNVIGIYNAFSKEYAINYTFSLGYVIIINILICQYLYKENIIEIGLKAFIIGSFLKAAVVFGRYGFWVFISARSIENVSANGIGLYCAVSCLLCVVFWMKKKEQNNVDDKKISIYPFLAIIFIVFCILTASRKALIFLAVPMIIFFILKSKNPLKIFLNITTIIIVLVCSYIALIKVDFLYNLVGNRVESMVNGLLENGDTDASTRTRLNLVERGMEWFGKKPWFGYGMSNFKALNEYYRGSDYYAHNNYVELLVDCGIIGTIIYYWIYLKILCMAWKNRYITPVFNPIILGIMISFIIGEYGLVTYNMPMYQLILLFFFVYLKRQTENKRKEENRLNEK